MTDVAQAAGSGIDIHLAPEVLGYVFGVPITNTLTAMWLVMASLIIFAIIYRRRIALVPGHLQAVLEWVIGFTYDFVEETLESESHARKYFPIIFTIFVFVLFLNWLGLVPGIEGFGVWQAGEHGMHLVSFVHPPDTDLNITLTFALIAFVTTEYAGITTVGALRYASKFVNFRSPISFMIGVIEFFSELARLVAFSFRLFGNIFAGKTLILIVMLFVPFVLPVPLMAFEIFVGFIQAFIFAILTLFFIKLAIEMPH